MLWHEQQWPTLQTLDKNLPVLVPLGSCEQHGRHLPVFVDSMQVNAIAEAVEKKIPDQVLLLPNLWLGSSHHHLDFPGTVSVRPSLYSQMIQDVARSLLKSGFQRIFFLNGHGGNEVPVAQALSELVAQDDLANSAMLSFSSWWNIGRNAMVAEQHQMTTANLSHACEYETSMLLYLRPDLVDLDKVRPTDPAMENEWCHTEVLGNRVSVFYRFNRVTPTGHMGRPQDATAEKGESLFTAVVDDVVRFLAEFSEWPVLTAVGPK